IYSIHRFFHSLVQQKQLFRKVRKLEQFPFDPKLLACKNKTIFPDLAIRLNKDRKIFTGGELIELKDSNAYAVSSFNSTIPSRSKKIAEIIIGENSSIKKQMENAGDDVFSLPTRDVFYLVRGKKGQRVKVCLVYGSFFETIGVNDLISQSFRQVLVERLKESGQEISEELKQTLVSLLSQQHGFSKVRSVEKSSVTLRFRIMTEVKAEGNILNTKKYPEIKDNTLNFVLPCHDINQERSHMRRLEQVFSKRELQGFEIFKMKHHFNGYFLVLQTEL
ncbi:MAG: hypothetical protein WAP52_02615, partial [Candidatus Sungiibacteriota bacterium]